MEQPVQIIYYYQRSENIEGIVVNLTMSTPSLDLAYNRNQFGDITMTQHPLT